jgi:ATP-dependent DNA ligase
MENIIIDGFNFTEMESMKYWSHPKSYDIKKKKEESKYMCISGDYIGARKYDGAWNMLIKDNDGNFHLRSRTESVNGGYTDKAEWIPWITNELSWIPNGTVLIGEICFPNNEGSRKITSVLNCLKDKCIERQKKNGILNFYIFDILAYKNKSLINTPFETRIRTYLEYELADITNNNEYVFMANYKEGPELWDLYGQIIAEGGEGIVITRKDCKYLPGKRTARMTLKMKKEINETIDAFLDGDYKPATKDYKGKEIETWPYWYNVKTGEKTNICMFTEYTNGETWEPITKSWYYGWASAVSFSVMKENNPVHVAWISGITDELKRDIVEKNNELTGKVAELTAMEVEHIDGEYSLRHAKIVQWRTDKKAEDCDFSQISDKA